MIERIFVALAFKKMMIWGVSNSVGAKGRLKRTFETAKWGCFVVNRAIKAINHLSRLCPPFHSSRLNFSMSLVTVVYP
jgi:hypothetical protein